MAKKKPTLSHIIAEFRGFLADRFSLVEDQASERETIEEINKGIAFKGTNLWILIFAILIASVGLNVNSTAVVIGAMLISPIMGPIMGVGVGIGIYDFPMILKGLRNLGIASAISVITSAIYFFISPLNEAQSELLARTTPTTWDVLIAFFGGAAGIIAGSRKEKSNTIPGVAIATALMPPLCTAGFGLATAQWNFFFGALYLYTINSVFISLSTFLLVRFLRFPVKEYLDPARESKVRRYVGLLVFATLVPSVYTAYRVVRENVFNRDAHAFIISEFDFENRQVISEEYTMNGDSTYIMVTLYGEYLDENSIDIIRRRLPDYGLPKTELVVRQGIQPTNNTFDDASKSNLKAEVFRDLYDKSEELIESKDQEIKLLQEEILRMRAKEPPIAQITEEAKALNLGLREIAINHSILSSMSDTSRLDTVCIAVAKFEKRPSLKQQQQLERWLAVKMGVDTMRLILY